MHQGVWHGRRFRSRPRLCLDIPEPHKSVNELESQWSPTGNGHAGPPLRRMTKPRAVDGRSLPGQHELREQAHHSGGNSHCLDHQHLMGGQGDLSACRELRSPGSTPGSLRASAVSYEIRQQPPRFVRGANVTSIRFRWGLVTHDSALQ